MVIAIFIGACVLLGISLLVLRIEKKTVAWDSFGKESEWNSFGFQNKEEFETKKQEVQEFLRKRERKYECVRCVLNVVVTLLFFFSSLGIVFMGVSIAEEDRFISKIEDYECENRVIKENIAVLIEEARDSVNDTVNDSVNDSVNEFMDSTDPWDWYKEIVESNTALVNSPFLPEMFERYEGNEVTIKKYKTRLQNCERFRWWLYFGEGNPQIYG